MAAGLAERYGERIAGVLSCYGRIIVTGAIPVICHAKDMTSFLYANGIRIFDYPQFAATLRDKVRENGDGRHDFRRLLLAAYASPPVGCRSLAAHG